MLFLIVLALIARVLFLTVFDHSFLMQQSNARVIRVVSLPAYRGVIYDRNNNPLALTVPVDAIWINPQDYPHNSQVINKMAEILSLSPQDIHIILVHNAKKQFVYLKRDVDPNIAKQISALAIPGVYIEENYKRYYPLGSAAAHVIGFTNVDNVGQEGIELEYNTYLQGVPGQEKVVKDRIGQTVAVLGVKQQAKPGKDLILSINNRIQFLAYQVLENAVGQFQAESGSVVVMNPKTGEILAMANLPSYDPNHRSAHDSSDYRNRAVTDMYEPGSVMKTFSIASALASGQFTPNSTIDTGKGIARIGRYWIHDDTNNGVATVTQILQKSSNIGAAKLTLALPPEHLINYLKQMGFGQSTHSGFPGESSGLIPNHRRWSNIDIATVAFGYGMTATTLQLAHGYSIIANNGKLCPVTFLKREAGVACPQVMDTKISQEMLTMLEAVVEPPGTGTAARIPGYYVAGKTGTAYIAEGKTYNQHAYTSSFVGMAPATNPQLVVAVLIRRPQGPHHLAASVAAPSFAEIMAGSLRILNIAPDKLTPAS